MAHRITFVVLKMKKTITAYLLFFLLFICTTALHAQLTENKKETPKPQAYSAGLSANLPILLAYTDTFSARTGWGLWGNAEYALGRGWAFTPGLAYNSFGFNQYFYNDSGVIQRRKITEHYFDLMAGFSFTPGGYNNGIRIHTGLGVSLLGQRNTDLPDELGRNISQITIDKKKSFSAGLLLSVGLSAPLSKKVDVGLNYLQGIPINVYPRDIVGRVGTLQLTVGYRFIPKTTPKNWANVEDEETSFALTTEPLYKKDSLVILVRLKENKKRILALKEGGYLNDAAELEEETRYNNMQVYEAVNKNFNQLTVYYFYDTDSKAVLAGNTDNVLLDTNLIRDASIVWPQKQVFFAEFATRFDEVSQTSGMYGWVVYTDNFKEVPPPFPAFVSNAYGLLSKKEVISRFNKKLAQYFQQQNSKNWNNKAK